MKQWALSLVMLLLICGCQGNVTENTAVSSNESVTPTVEQTETPATGITSSVAEGSVYAPNTLHLRFNEFELVIDSLEVWDEDDKLKNTQIDSAIVYLELGESIEGRTIRIRKLKEGRLKVSQRHENSITIMNEGPHCDLTEWKHYNSEWTPLTLKGDYFVTASYAEEDWERFIEIDMEELRKEVRSYCGDYWADHIKEATSPTDYPCGVSISRIFLKVEFQHPDTHESLERIVSFEIPMGC